MKFGSRSRVLGTSIFFLVLVVLCGGILARSVQAQVAGAIITGTVADKSGLVIPNAQVSITNVATGINRTVTTNSEGFYSAPNLQPGTYGLKFTAQGFKTEVRSGIAVTVGATEVLDQTMQVGTAVETIEVTSEAPSVQLTTSDISAVVNATTVRELPLNGRSWTDLATLQPGVSAIQTQPTFEAGTDRGNRGFGQQLTISGARPQQNNYRLDGVSMNDYANGSPGSVLGGSLGVDAIQEFSVLTSNYSAEYGKTSGGVVNAVTRSGTNQFHGSIYEFLRNSALDARNFFDRTTIPPFRRNQFGGAVGGPIVKNGTFFFFDYEGIRQSKGITTFTTVPSANARAGKLCSNPPGPDPSNPCSPTSLTPGPNTDANGVDLFAKQYFTFWSLPNGPILGNGDTGVFTFSGQRITNENFITTRIDHRISNSDGLFGTYVFDRTPYSSPDGLNNVEFDTRTSRHAVVLEETHTFRPSLVNSVRFGWNHEAVNNNESTKAINPDAAKLSLGTFPGRAAAQVFIAGVTPFTGGVGGSPTYFYHWNSFQLYDDAFVSKAKHSIRFGFAAERMMLNVLADTDPNGIWRFDDMMSFLTNAPHKFQGGIASTLTPRNIHQMIFGGYLQDDWRWRPNLTFNLGMRYEMSTVPTETSGKLANLPTIDAATPHLGNPFFRNPTLKNFEPRFGFAWDPRGNGTTAVRGGIGLFDVLPLPYQFILLTTQSAPFFQYPNINDSPAMPLAGTFFNGLSLPLPLNSLRSTYVEDRQKRNYVSQWNLNVQHQITPSLAGMVAYVGSRGVHQPFRADEIDMVLPMKVLGRYVWPVPIGSGMNGSGNPINANFGSIRGMFYSGRSYYNALELQLSKRMSHGLQLQGSYTWGKSIDTSSATIAGDSFGNSISSLHWYDLRANRGLSDFNIGRTLVVNGTWEVPSYKSGPSLAQWALGGWELGLIFTANDGVPFTPTWATGGDPVGSLSSDDWAFPDRLGGPGCNTLTNPGNPLHYIKTECFSVPLAPPGDFWTKYCDPMPPIGPKGAPQAVSPPLCFNLRGNAGRNILIGPGLVDLDFSVFKNNYIRRISERFNVQFRAEIFNILNRPNFAPPTVPDNTDIFDGTGTLLSSAGLLSRTTTTAREIQFAVKIIF